MIVYVFIIGCIILSLCKDFFSLFIYLFYKEMFNVIPEELTKRLSLGGVYIHYEVSCHSLRSLQSKDSPPGVFLRGGFR